MSLTKKKRLRKRRESIWSRGGQKDWEAAARERSMEKKEGGAPKQ